MPHFFIKAENIKDGFVKIDDLENYRHIARSLRMRRGENLLLIDETQIQYETEISEINSKEIICEIKKSYPSKRDLDFDLFLAQSPLRSDSQLTIMEKAAELGVRAVYPVITDNCALKTDKKDKWQKVMYEASKQCERAKIPVCYDLTSLDEVLEEDFDKILVFAERGAGLSLKSFLGKNPINKGERVLVVIGPEGGFSNKEFAYFREKKLPLITLGDLILKAETAVITALGDIIYEYQG